MLRAVGWSIKSRDWGSERDGCMYACLYMKADDRRMNPSGLVISSGLLFPLPHSPTERAPDYPPQPGNLPKLTDGGASVRLPSRPS
ncbi:hypothetical protein PNOK_0132900 [Pyrrhoderma noxium]|uniref:Uncharacterized protein n=1 Tax=Pyrrhoderma noxium TaxID=2282107 RepID=A0A286UXH8_9AGAM|nr:hypothetical protein PNOK_0132900 [Pyrrhoderma noxium]